MRNKPLLHSVSFALFISIIGFGIMNLLWIIDGGHSGLPGLYDYRAATIGDGICLPILVFAMTYFCKTHNTYNEKRNKYIHKRSLLIGLISGFIGLSIQISWLFNPDIGLNWTIPKVHYFNFAGWYHCFYFSMMFGLIAYFLSKVFLLRKSETLKNTISETIQTFLLAFGGSFYLMLQRLDDYGNQYSYDFIFTSVAILLIIILFVYYRCSSKKTYLKDIVVSLSGIACAYGIAVIVTNFNANYLVYAIIMFLMSFSYIFEVLNDPKRYYMGILLISMPILLMNIAIFTETLSLDSLFLVIMLFVIPIGNVYIQITSDERPDDWNKVFLHCKFGVVYQLVMIASVILINIIPTVDDKSAIIDFLFNTLLITLVHYNIVAIFDELIVIEDNRLKTDDGYRKMTKTRSLSYLQITTIVAGAAIYLFLTYIGFIEFQAMEMGIDLSIRNLTLIIICILLFMIMLFIMIVFKKSEKKILMSLFLLASYVFIDLGMYFLKTPILISLNPLYCCAIFQAIGSSLLVAESFYSNIYRIRGIPKKTEYFVNSFVVFIGSFVMLIFTLLPAMGEEAQPSKSLLYILFGILGDVIVLVGLPCLCFILTKPNYYEQEVAPEGVLGEIAKNGFLGVLIAVLAGAVPIYIYIVNSSWIKIVLAIITLIGGVYWAVTYCLENNVRHLAKRELEVKSQGTNANAELQLAGLEKHLQSQNVCALISLLLYCMIPLGVEFFLNIGKGKEKLLNKYIPQLEYHKQHKEG